MSIVPSRTNGLRGMSRKLLLKANFRSNRSGLTLRCAHQACGGGRFCEDDRHPRLHALHYVAP
jgi:hypothetical protein